MLYWARERGSASPIGVPRGCCITIAASLANRACSAPPQMSHLPCRLCSLSQTLEAPELISRGPWCRREFAHCRISKRVFNREYSLCYSSHQRLDFVELLTQGVL